jgi:hypothetical protein
VLCLLLILFLVEASARSPGSCSSNFYSSWISLPGAQRSHQCSSVLPLLVFLIVCEFLEVKAEIVLELFVQKTRVFLVLVVLL